MKLLIIAAGAAGAVLALGSCATMSAEQCMAGDWGGQGYADGQSGLTMSRLAEHAEACAKVGIVPDDVSYAAGRQQGLLRYCTPDKGFEVGRAGSSYAGVCPAELEAEFLPAYNDGRVVYEVVSALESARSSVSSLGGRLEELDDKISAKQAEARAEGLTEEQRDRILDRVQELRRERADRQRDWRRAQEQVDEAERDLRDVRRRFQYRYGGW